MKRLAYPLASLCLAIAIVSLVGLFSIVPAKAQTKDRNPSAPPPPKGLSAGEGPERLVPDERWSKDNTESKQFQELRKGGSAANKGELLDHAAQWYAYRLTHAEHQEPKSTSSRGMHDLVKEALDQIIDLRDPKKPATRAQQEYMKEFGKRFTSRLQEVVKNPKVIARMNAAIVLASLAASGQEDAVDVLVEVLQDPKENDAVKFYALRGLNKLFASGRGESPFSDKGREARVIAALLEYVAHKPALSKEAAPEELAAVSYVRTEAVAALGLTLYPAGLEVDKKVSHIERPTALTLLRVLRKDGIQPEPSLAEQVAAAVSICQLHSKELEQYNADYAAYHVGRFIVDFASQYNNKAQQEKEKKEPWKIYAHHLSHGLALMVAELARPPASEHSAYVAELAAEANNRLLNPIQTSNMANPQPNDLSAWLDQHPPKSKTVYKGMPEAVIHEGEKAGG
jgi:hypothetical protein